MKPFDLKSALGGGIWKRLNRPLFEDAASHLSESIDEAAAEPGAADDPAVTAILKAAVPRALPSQLHERSWAGLERELFSSPPVRPPLPVPYGDRAYPRGIPRWLCRLPRFVVALAILAFAAAVYGIWIAPNVRGRAAAQESVRAWNRVQDYRAAIQFLSRVPGDQMQWSGTEYYAAPDLMRVEMDSMGIPATIIVNGDAGAVQGPVGRSDVARFRFAARVLRMDQLMEALQAARDVRYEGGEDVVGQPCDVLSFSLPAASNEAGSGNAPRQMTDARVWISREVKIPVQVEMYMPDGTVAVAYRFTRILGNVSMRPQIFDLPLVGRHYPDEGVVMGHTLVHVELRSFAIGSR